MKKLVLAIILISLFFLPLNASARETSPAPAQEEILEAQVVQILKEDVITEAGKQSLYQNLQLLITKGSLTGQEITVEVGNIPIVGQAKYKIGDKLLVSKSKDFEGNDVFYITDYVRRTPLLVLFLIFVILAVGVGGWRGGTSLLGLGVSFSVIFVFILPKIYAGQDPVWVTILGSLLIIPLTFYLSHGFNRKTTVAIGGTVVALIITGVLAKIFVETARLTGYASEEAGFLQVARPGVVNIKGLVLAGIIIGALGVLDDITVAQAAVVQQLKETSPKIKFKELFFRALSVGQDHIASMVNTLVLVYTGAALPLLLLFIDNPLPFSQVVNYEIIAEEIIRTLVGSIGLITAVPITTLLASRMARKK